MKKFLTSWQVWAVIAAALGALLVLQGSNLVGILPFAVFLICPLMMVFMMKGHSNHKQGGDKDES